ncbi:haloacid dehalogenase-like hydrolase [Polychaeton citri CBS 116435]|uniref:Haloacid dehalogenase-like hydrolase n=1 Tax=Polychaeton citri CBS 116435 TaxID=1314669 RepID=A0A9P4QFY1_9PEZI|nr:haloacid dehalogenase-like hydrolase [Polychaeton citri CBS 116435]
MTTKRNLLLCFDAFGTIFEPKRSVFQQYAEVARQLGLGGFSDHDVSDAFKQAFKQESKEHPNYGKKSDMGAERWWTNIITNTFRPLLPEGQQLPKELAPRLLTRFGSKEGYHIFPDFIPTLRAFQQRPQSSPFDKVVIGVITNSDDRVPGILSSLGLRVSPLRYGLPPPRDRGVYSGDTFELDNFDIHFHCMSYDVGFEKPEKRIFEAADEMLCKTLDAAGLAGEASVPGQEWLKVYVGDDYAKDGEGAMAAGWQSVIVDRSNAGEDRRIRWVDRGDSVDVSGAPGRSVVGVADLNGFRDSVLGIGQ